MVNNQCTGLAARVRSGFVRAVLGRFRFWALVMTMAHLSPPMPACATWLGVQGAAGALVLMVLPVGLCSERAKPPP